MVVCDAFSTCQNTELFRKDITLDEAFIPCNQRIMASTEGELPDEQAKLIAALATPFSPEILEEDGTSTMRGRVMVHLLCENPTGEVDCYDKACEYTVPLPQATGLTALCEAQVERVTAQIASGTARAEVTISVTGAFLGHRKIPMLEQVEATGPREKEESDIALRIYFAHEGEEVFDIARRYATSPQQIVQANALDDAACLDTARTLLIPCTR